MDNLLTKEEKAKAKPYILQILDNAEENGIKKGIEKGMEKAVSKFLKKNPAMPDAQVADIFEISVGLVQKIRQQSSNPSS